MIVFYFKKGKFFLDIELSAGKCLQRVERTEAGSILVCAFAQLLCLYSPLQSDK